MPTSEKAACARTYPRGEPKSKNNICSEQKKRADCYQSVLRVLAGKAAASSMLTYLVASFVGLLHQHPPLVVQLHGHAAAAVGVFAHPAEELLQLPPQGGVGVGAGLGVAGARHQSLWGGGHTVAHGQDCTSAVTFNPVLPKASQSVPELGGPA